MRKVRFVSCLYFETSAATSITQLISMWLALLIHKVQAKKEEITYVYILQKLLWLRKVESEISELLANRDFRSHFFQINISN